MYSNGLARFRGGITNDQTTLNLGGNGLTTNLQLTSGGATGSARFYGSTETTGNATFAGTLSVGGVITAPGGTSTEWNTAYDNSVTAISNSGTSPLFVRSPPPYTLIRSRS